MGPQRAFSLSSAISTPDVRSVMGMSCSDLWLYVYPSCGPSLPIVMGVTGREEEGPVEDVAVTVETICVWG